MRAAWPLLLVVGCDFRPIPFVDGDGSVPDPIDAQVDDAFVQDVAQLIDAQLFCAGTFLRVCVNEPSQALVLTGPTTIDTATAPCLPYTSVPELDICVLAGSTVDVIGEVRFTGPRPIVLVSRGPIAVIGTLDVASRRPNDFGAGAEPQQACSIEQGPTVAFFSSAGGAAGGTFAGAGGNGGNGGRGGSGGVASDAITVDAFRGGCGGGRGASFFANADGERGLGGGAVALLAMGNITIGNAGVINASGSGGARSDGDGNGGSGGGGGSGGMILLEGIGTTVMGNGRMIANGGGGGEGSTGGNDGNSGNDPTAPNTAAAGGTAGATLGGDGGSGSVGMTPQGLPGSNGGQTQNTGGGGGGGGGGAGAIMIVGGANNVVQSNVSPPPILDNTK